MFINRFLHAFICLLYLTFSTQAELTEFKLMHTDVQFKPNSSEKILHRSSLRTCIMECQLLDTRCGSFSLDAVNTCSINVLHLYSEVKDTKLVFEPMNGTRIFGKQLGKILICFSCIFASCSSFNLLLKVITTMVSLC